jgi:hypothetical protein
MQILGELTTKLCLEAIAQNVVRHVFVVRAVFLFPFKTCVL